MLRFLVVDDDADIQLLLRTVLGGYDVTTAASGVEAVALAEARPFDLVLLDAMMPGMDGFQVLGRLRTQGLLGSTRVVMLTAQVAEEHHQRAYEGGADAYLTKPFDPKDLLALVAEVLARSPAERDRSREEEVEKAKLLNQLERRFD